MNWTEQALELMKSFTETQRKMWEGWFELAGQPAGDQKNVASEWYAQWQDAAKKSLETWEAMTERALQTQAEWVKSDSFANMFPTGSEEARKLVAAWSEQTAALMRTWAESQKRLWEALFDMAASAGRTEGASGEWFSQWERMTRQTLSSWEDLVKRATETQQSWTESFLKNGKQQDSGQDAESRSSSKA